MYIVKSYFYEELALTLYKHENCFFFGKSKKEIPVSFNSKKEAKDTLIKYFGYFDQNWKIVKKSKS